MLRAFLPDGVLRAMSVSACIYVFKKRGLVNCAKTHRRREKRKKKFSFRRVVVARARRVQTNGRFPKRVNSIHRVLPDAFRAFAVMRYLRTIAVSFLSLREIYARVLISF